MLWLRFSPSARKLRYSQNDAAAAQKKPFVLSLPLCLPVNKQLVPAMQPYSAKRYSQPRASSNCGTTQGNQAHRWTTARRPLLLPTRRAWTLGATLRGLGDTSDGAARSGGGMGQFGPFGDGGERMLPAARSLGDTITAIQIEDSNESSPHAAAPARMLSPIRPLPGIYLCSRGGAYLLPANPAPPTRA